PGFLMVRLRSWSQPAFTFVFVLPPPVERQATPPCLVLLRTSVPWAKMLPGLTVSALKVAKLPKPSPAASTSSTKLVMKIFRCLLTDSMSFRVPAPVPRGAAARGSHLPDSGELVCGSMSFSTRSGVHGSPIAGISDGAKGDAWLAAGGRKVRVLLRKMC